MLLNELYKVINRIKERGFREGWRYMRGHIYSTSKYFVFRHNMKEIPDHTPRTSDFEIVEVRDPDANLLPEIYRVWPSETRPSNPNCMTELLKEHLKNDAMCFVLLDKDKLVGANWISRPNNYYSNLGIPYLQDEYVSYWTFIVPDYRGIGASKLLKSYCLRISKKKGVSSVISVSSVKNTPSVKMNLGVGYKIIGTLTERHRWFRYSQYFETSNGEV